MGKRNVFIGLTILFLMIIVGGGYYLLSQKQSARPSDNQEPIQQEIIPTIAPEDLGLTLTARSDKKAIKFEIANIKDITSIDYEISYLAKGNIPRGAIGHLTPKEGETKIATNFIELGSCSSGKCKYDEGVTSVKLILKITKTDQKTYQAEKGLEL